jgi:hypothetical protein
MVVQPREGRYHLLDRSQTPLERPFLESAPWCRKSEMGWEEQSARPRGGTHLNLAGSGCLRRNSRSKNGIRHGYSLPTPEQPGRLSRGPAGQDQRGGRAICDLIADAPAPGTQRFPQAARRLPPEAQSDPDPAPWPGGTARLGARPFPPSPGILGASEVVRQDRSPGTLATPSSVPGKPSSPQCGWFSSAPRWLVVSAP